MKQQHKTVRKTCKALALCALSAGVALSAWAGTGVRLSADAAGKVNVKPYLEYLFDTSDTLYENTGKSAGDTSKDYTLQKLGNAAPQDMCYGGELNLEDNGMLYLQGENNPFANGKLTDFTFAMQSKTEYSSWYSAPVSWDSLSGNPDNGEGAYSDHRYTRITAASSSDDSDWLRFTDSQLKNNDGPHWESYSRGDLLYGGDRAQGDSGFITVLVSVDTANKSMLVRAYKGFEEVGKNDYKLTQDWKLYQDNDTDKIFTLGGAWDSRGEHIGFKIRGRIDNVRVYDFAMTEAQIASYARSQDLQLVVDGVEIDPGIVGGKITVDNETPKVGEEVTLTVTPDDGAELKEITVDGEVLKPDGSGAYKTVMKEGGLFISATFLRSLPVEIGNVANGRITPDKTIAKVGEAVTFTPTPSEGYGLKRLSVNGLAISAENGVYAAEMTDDGMTVTAEFAKLMKVTVASDIENGTVTPSKTSGFAGERVTFTVTPDEGYEIERVLVNGKELQEDYGTYAVITEGDVTVSATFRKIGGSGCGSAISLGGGALLATAGIASGVAAILIVRAKKQKGDRS